jgi:hypothetical protein
MQLVIKPVEGRMVLDQRVLGTFSKRYHGYAPTGERRPRSILGKAGSVETHEWQGDEEITVTERDGFYRSAILSGDVDYVSNADGSKEVALVLATARNRKAREEAAKAAKKHAADAAAAHELALEAAERGEELNPAADAEENV